MDEPAKVLGTLSAPCPDHYLMLDELQKNNALLESDHCIISYTDRVDYFIKTYLIQKLTDSPETLEYGVWISISRENLLKYLQQEATGEIFAGYLCTRISPYQDMYEIKMNIIISNQDQIPESVPQEYQNDVPFVRDYYEGITKAEALRRIQEVTK